MLNTLLLTLLSGKCSLSGKGKGGRGKKTGKSTSRSSKVRLDTMSFELLVHALFAGPWRLNRDTLQKENLQEQKPLY